MSYRRAWHFHDRYWLTIDWFPDRRLSARLRLILVTLWLALTGGVDLGETELIAKGTYRLRLLDSRTENSILQDISPWKVSTESALQVLISSLEDSEPEAVEEKYFSHDGPKVKSLLDQGL